MPVRADRFDQLTGAFDDPIAPRPAFAARLRAQVLAELAESPHQIASTPNGRKEPIMLATVATPADHPTRRLRQGTHKGKLLRPRWTRTTALINVAAILLLLVGIARFFAPAHTAPDSTYRLPAIASQPSGSPATPQVVAQAPVSMWGANPGNTGEMAANPPAGRLGSPQVLPYSLSAQRFASASIINQGVLYLATIPRSTFAPGDRIEAIDLANNKVLWSVWASTQFGMAATPDRLFVLAEIKMAQGPSFLALQAYDAHTGKLLWQGPQVPQSQNYSFYGPRLIDNAIYLARLNGQVDVFDPATGKRLRTLGEDVPVTKAPSVNLDDQPVPVLPNSIIAADKSHLFVLSSTGELEAINLSTGKTDWRASLASTDPKIYLYTGFISVADGVVTVRAFYGTSNGLPTNQVGEGTYDPWTPTGSRVFAFDASRGHQRWTRDVGTGLTPQIMVDDTVVFAEQRPNNSDIFIQALHLTDGSQAWETSLSAAKSSGMPLLTAAGSVIYAVQAIGTQELTVIENGRRISTWDIRSATQSEPGKAQSLYQSPAWLDQSTLLTVNADGTVFGLTYERPLISTPSAPPIATPQASPVAAQPGANPGQTNQYDVSIGTPKRLNLLGEARPAAQVGAGPIVSDGTLYRIDEPTGQAAANASTVSAVSLVDGSARTVFSDPAHNADAVMMRGDQLLVVANPVIGTTTNAALIAVDPATGHALWSLDLFAGPAAEAKPLLAGNMVFVADQSGKVYGIDLTAHRVTWSALVSSLGEPPELLAADDSLLYVVNGFDLSAIDQATGATRWQADLSRDLLGITSITVGGGHIIVGGPIAPGGDAGSATPASAATPEGNLNRSRVVAITTQNHAIEWHWDTPDPLSKLFVVTGGKVIVGHGQGPFGNATALNLATGKVAWQLDGATPVFADRDQVVAVTLQVSAAPGTRLSTPATSGRVPIFQKPPETVTSVTLLGIDPATGATQWVQGENLGIGNPVVFLPIDQGVVILLSSGQVVVLRD